MKIEIESNILRYCLQNVYFINGTAYAGKSTMARMLAEKHGMILCGENYHDELSSVTAEPDKQPALCYFRTMSGWQEFLNRPPEVYAQWIEDCSREATQYEIALLLRLSASGRRIVADTNIAPEVLREISDYRRVALMLSPESLSVDRFFDRDDPDKRFLLSQIEAADDPVKTMANFRACLARINGPEARARFAQSGLFTVTRADATEDTKAQTLRALEAHFGL